MKEEALKQYHDELKDAIAVVSEKYGVAPVNSFLAKTGSEFKLSTVLFASNGDKSGEQVAFETYAPYFLIDPTWFGKTFSHKDQVFTVCGIRPKARKRPIIAKSDSSGINCAIEFVKAKLSEPVEEKAEQKPEENAETAPAEPVATPAEPDGAGQETPTE